MSEPRASVIIPCRDAMSHLDDQLGALSDQVGGLDFEVLLVDNGLNDDIESVGQNYPNLTIRVIDATSAAGTAYARNRGIEAARGEALLFCDADDVVLETWVCDGVELLSTYPAFNGGAVEIESHLFDHGREFVRDLARAQIEPPDDSLPSFETGGYPILLGCSFGMRRSVAIELGGFDESFGSQAEDNDLGFRLIDHLGFVPDARYVGIAYRLRAAGTATFRRGFDAGRKHAMVCARHDAFSISPSYRGHWIIRPARAFVMSALRGDLDVDGLGRWIGCLVGRVRCTIAPMPRVRTLTSH